MTPKTTLSSDDVIVKAWSDLEEPLRDLTYMSGIAHDLAYELLEIEKLRKDDEYVMLRLLPRQHEQLFFAIDKVHNMASDLERLYHK
jgi:hypothetical protein